MPDLDAEALLTLLETERAAIRTGDFEGLEALAARKANLAARLADDPPARGLAVRLDRALARNARLLSAACDGIRAAQARLTALRDVRRGLSLYTASGDRTTVAQRPGTFEHKA